jgi:hypothetical protein
MSLVCSPAPAPYMCSLVSTRHLNLVSHICSPLSFYDETQFSQICRDKRIKFPAHLMRMFL